MKLKRTVYIMLVLLMLGSLAACGNAEPGNEETADRTDAQTKVTAESTGTSSVRPEGSSAETSGTETEEPLPQTEYKPVSGELRVDYQFTEEYMSPEIYPMKSIVKDTGEYYDAIVRAYPDRPVIAVITHRMLSGVSVENNDAINRWLEENGYGFSLMIYGLPFRTEEIRAGLTFEEKLKEYVDAGGRCDLIIPDANWSTLSRKEDDSLWHYVEDGLITAVEDIADPERLKAVEESYGSAFMAANREQGKIYGFSASTHPGTAFQSYVAVAEEVLPLVEGKTPEKLGRALVFDQKFLQKARKTADTASAVMVFSVTPYELILPLVYGDRYVPVNNLQVYMDSGAEDPTLLGLWELPEYEKLVREHVSNLDNGLWRNGGELDDGAAAMIYFSSYPDRDIAQSHLNAILAENGVTRSYTVIPLAQFATPVGIENSVLVCSASENKELACDVALDMLLDAGLAGVMASGVPGDSYTVENGQIHFLKEPYKVCLYYNPYYSLDATGYLGELGQSVAAKKNSALKKYGDFCADFTGCGEAADAVALWGSDLWDYLSIGTMDEFPLPSGVLPSEFLDSPVPDIEPLRLAIEEQLQ